MTKKDFILIAKVLKDTNATTGTVGAMSVALSTTNPNFNFHTFHAACGMVK
jgi:hypothetical protein